MELSVTRDDGLTISTDRALLDIDRIHAWLAASYWASERDRATVQRSMEHSLPYGVYAPDSAQVALARATTDFTTYAWIGDVVVDEAWRGKGIGTWLVRVVVDHLTGIGVPRFVLATRDAHGVYERAGFTPLRKAHYWMGIDRRRVRP